jgi:hypothetical protein
MQSALPPLTGTDRPVSSTDRADGMVMWWLTAAWTAAGIVLWLMFPMTASAVLPLCVVAPLLWYWAGKRQLPRHAPSLPTAALVLAGVYLLINASWSLSPTSALRAVGLIFVIAAVLHVVLNTLPELEAPALRAMAAGTLAGLAAGGVVLCIEVFSDQALRRLLIPLVPALLPYPQHLAMGAGQVTGLMPYLTNVGISVLTLLFWPAALITSRLGLTLRQKYGMLIAAAVAAATTFASEHATSKVAFAGAGAAFLMFQVGPLLARRLVVAGWMAATLLVVPTASFMYGAEAHRALWLPESARHRIVIWKFTSEEVVKAPLLGAGISTARALHEGRDHARPLAPGTRFQLGTGLHSHNAYLQVWYETGAAGALILLGFGILVLRALTRFPVELQPYLAATFVACALLAASAFSIWAPWFMASLAMAGVFAALGAALPAGPREKVAIAPVAGVR